MNNNSNNNANGNIAASLFEGFDFTTVGGTNNKTQSNNNLFNVDMGTREVKNNSENLGNQNKNNLFENFEDVFSKSANSNSI